MERSPTEAMPPSEPCERRRQASREAAPDFDRLPSRPELWCPSAGVATPSAWPGRRSAIRARWRRWMLGAMPPAPDDPDVHEVARLLRADGGRERRFEVRPVGVPGPALRMTLLLPADQTEPVPALVTQTCHAAWAGAALSRGWAACLVSACDGDDDMEAIGETTRADGFDWSSLARRAWALSRVLDLLRDVVEVEPTRVLVGGHGRNGKAALIAAAHDDRFAAVVSSSSGVLGAIPARLCSDRHFGAGVELLTRRFPDDFHPRLRFFSGREDRLPTDAHELLACIAPRPVLLSVAQHDELESTWAAERTVDAVRPVWSLLGAPDALRLRWREGGHAAGADAVEGYLDWAEQVLLGRGVAPPAAAVLHGGAWRAWPASRLAPPRGWRPHGPAWTRRPVARAVGQPALAGTAIPRGRSRPSRAVAPPSPPRARVVADGVVRLGTATPDGVAVDVFLAAGPLADGAPLVLWLPPLCRPTGYRAGHEDGEPLHLALARDGFAVACHDPAGTGARLLEGAALATRHPRWSPLGRMLHDARATLAAAVALPGIDARAPLATGYGAGALVAAHLLAVEPHLAGAALVAPSSGDPLLPVHGPLPAAGLTDLLAAHAGRPVLVLGPRVGADGRAALAAARAAGVEHEELDGHHRLAPVTRRIVRAWLRGVWQGHATPARRAA